MISAKVNEKCNGCGGCLNSIYFEEMSNGDVQAKSGTIIPDEALDELMNIRSECPCNAIVVECGKKTAKEITKELLAYIDQIKDVKQIDSADEVAMNEYGHHIKFNYSLTYGKDGFHSYDRAESALRSEIHCIWDDRKDYALAEAQKYVHDELRKYWDINYPESIYAETQTKIKAAVKAISNGLYSAGIIENELLESDYRVEFTEWTTRWLLEPECISKEWAQQVYDKLDSDYMSIALHKAKIEPYEEPVDGLFGKTKYKTMWQYTQTGNCEDKIRSQIVSKLISVSKYSAKKEINKIIDEYNKQLVEIRRKLRDLIEGNHNGFIQTNDERNAISKQINDNSPKNVPVMIKLTQEMIERREYGIPSRRGHVSEKDKYLLENRDEINTEFNDYYEVPMDYDITYKVKFSKDIETLSDNEYTIFLQDYFYRKFKGYPVAVYEIPLDNKQRIQLYNRTALDSGHPEYMVDYDGNEISEKFISVTKSTDIIYLTDTLKERRKYGEPVRRGINTFNHDVWVMEENTDYSDYCGLSNLDIEQQRASFKKDIDDCSLSFVYVGFLQDYFYRKYMGYVLPYFELPLGKPEKLKLYNKTAMESAHPEYMVDEYGEPLYEEWFYFDNKITLGDILGEK